MILKLAGKREKEREQNRARELFDKLLKYMKFCFQKRKTVLNDAKDDVQKMAKKLKKAKNKLKRAQADIEEAGAVSINL